MSEDAPKPKIKLTLANLKNDQPKAAEHQPAPAVNPIQEKIPPALTLKTNITPARPTPDKNDKISPPPAAENGIKPKITLKLNKNPDLKMGELEAEIKRKIEEDSAALKKTEPAVASELKINDSSIDETQRIMESPSGELLNLNSLNINLKTTGKTPEEEPPLVFDLEADDPLKSINPRNNSLDPLRLKGMGSMNKNKAEKGATEGKEVELSKGDMKNDGVDSNLPNSAPVALDSLFSREQSDEQKSISLEDAFKSTGFNEKKTGKRTTLILLCVTLAVVIAVIYFAYITFKNIAS